MLCCREAQIKEQKEKKREDDRIQKELLKQHGSRHNMQQGVRTILLNLSYRALETLEIISTFNLAR